MKMIDLPRARQAADDLEQLLRLLWREHRGRLVQHEDVRVAVERLQDLHPLLLADRDVLDRRPGIDRQPVPVGDLLHPPLRLAHVEHHAVVRWLLREDDVLRHRHHRNEHEVLVHHPHAGLDRGGRRAEPDGLALDQDLALVRVVEAVEDVHQGGLARPVLAQERVYLALTEIEADVVVRDDAREPLGDVAHLEDLGLLGHSRDCMPPRQTRCPTEVECRRPRLPCR